MDQRALDALKEFPPEGALGVLAQFLESNLAHVSNKSAFLCGVMKTYRVKSRGSNSTSSVTGKKVAVCLLYDICLQKLDLTQCSELKKIVIALYFCIFNSLWKHKANQHTYILGISLRESFVNLE